MAARDIIFAAGGGDTGPVIGEQWGPVLYRDTLNRVRAFSNGTYWAVGQNAALYVSTTLTTWSMRSIPYGTFTFNDIAWDGTTYVAVGTSSNLYTSTDGVSWTKRTVSFSAVRVVYGAGKFVALDLTNGLYSSSDGITWTSTYPIADCVSIIYANSLFLAVITTGTNSSFATSSDGVTWTPRFGSSVAALVDVAWNGTKFLAFGTQVLESASGTSWSYIGDGSSIYPGFTVVSVAANTSNGLFAILASDSKVYTTASGTSAVNSAVATQQVTAKHLLRTSSYWLTVGNNGIVSGTSLSDATGFTLYAPALPSIQWNAAAYGGGKFVVAGASGYIAYSSDGLSWTSVGQQGTLDWNGVAHNGSMFVVVGNSGSVRTSTDGFTWVTQTTGYTQALNAVAWSPTLSLWCAVGASGRIITSPDAITWTARTSGVSSALYGICWTGSNFIVCGQTGQMMNSSSGTSWGAYTLGTATYYSVAWNGSLAVVCGTGGALYTSADGLGTWTSRSAGTQALRAVVWTGSRWVAQSSSTTSPLRVSSNGTTWNLITTNSSKSMYALAFSGSFLIAAGANSAILGSLYPTSGRI